MLQANAKMNVTNLTICKEHCINSDECMSFNYFALQDNGKCLLKSIKPETDTFLHPGGAAQYFGPKFCKGDSGAKFTIVLENKIII